MDKPHNIVSFLEEQRKRGASLASKYLRPGVKPAQKILEDLRKDYEKGRTTKDFIRKTEEYFMLKGDIDLSYEGALYIYREAISRTEKRSPKIAEVVKSLDPVADYELIANILFCTDPEIRKKTKLENLYKVALKIGEKKETGIQDITKHHRPKSGRDYLFSSQLEELLSEAPKAMKDIDQDSEEARRVRILLFKRAEREAFPVFRDDPEKAFALLERKITEANNEDVKLAYLGIRDLYNIYTSYNVEVLNDMGEMFSTANQKFRDPTTGKLGVLPSLHQKIALYHLHNEKRFGVFDGCGTGKTAIAALAQPLIEYRMKHEGREFRRALVICPNSAKKAWKEGLAGEEHERYLNDKQEIVVLNGNIKDKEFLDYLKNKKWIILNKEQLITRILGSNRSFAEALADLGFDYVIFDESHHFKSLRDKTPKERMTESAAARFIGKNAEYLCLLSGTPIPDKMSDYAVMYSLLHPDKCEDPKQFKKLYEENARILYTLFSESTVRRTSEDINDHLEWKEAIVRFDLDSLQKQLYDFIMSHKFGNNYLTQARKALLDPRLVDPVILQKAGLLNKISWENSTKYKKLERILTSPGGPVAKGDKFIIFSSMFRQGVMFSENVKDKEHKGLKEKYEQLGLIDSYHKLQLDISLDTLIRNWLQGKFGKDYNIEVIDGTIGNVERREELVKELNNGLTGLLCTTDSGGESLNFTAANWAIFLDEDYSPTTTEQAIYRILRNGQRKKVKIIHLTANNTLEQPLLNYVRKKDIIRRIATDGRRLSEDEREFLEEHSGKHFLSFLKKTPGGESINVYEGKIESINDFGIIKRSKGSGKEARLVDFTGSPLSEAQRISKLIGIDPVNCWKNPIFAEKYITLIKNLSIPVVHRARVCDLVRRADEKQIVFPGIVLAEASGPSVLYDTYQTLKPLIENRGYKLPIIVDRDFSEFMLRPGKNPNKLFGNMNGEQSAFKSEIFDMIDNGSLPLLHNPEEVKKALLEANRILKPEGILEIVIDSRRFKPEFYSGLEQLGFELMSGKNEGFALSKEFKKRLREEFGEHYAEAYASKLGTTSLILARKEDKPAENIDADQFWFDKIAGLEDDETNNEKIKEQAREEKSEEEKVSVDVEKAAREIERASKGGRGVKQGKKIIRVLPDEISGLTKQSVRITGEK